MTPVAEGLGRRRSGFLEEIPDVLDLVAHAEDYRVEYNTVRPHEALAWNRPETSIRAWLTR